MLQQDFVQAVRERGFDVQVWAVYAEDRREWILGGGVSLALRGAFWRRGEAYAFAARSHAQSSWHHYYVFCVDVDVLWAGGDRPRGLRFEAVFDDARDLPPLEITPAELARALAE